MKAVITSFGSMGDIQPMIALADRMRKAGDELILAFSPNFETRVRELGLEFHPIGPPLETEKLRKMLGEQMATQNAAEQAIHFLQSIVEHLPKMYRELRELCRGANVLISPPFQPACRMVHDAIEIPFVSIQLSYFKGAGSTKMREATAPILNQCRAAEGFDPLEDPFNGDGLSSQLVLYAVSKHILQPSALRPSHHRVVGFFFLEQESWTPEPALNEFLESGDPPIALTLGSMIHQDPKGLTSLLLEALETAKCRAIIQQGWGRLDAVQTNGNVYFSEFIPHDWLFERVQCVVHHGGAGTTAATWRAGKPSVIIPHVGDQAIWAGLSQGLRCSGPPIHIRALSAKKLGTAIRETMDRPQYAVAAKEMSRKISAEQGVAAARQAIQELVAAN